MRLGIFAGDARSMRCRSGSADDRAVRTAAKMGHNPPHLHVNAATIDAPHSLHNARTTPRSKSTSRRNVVARARHIEGWRARRPRARKQDAFRATPITTGMRRSRSVVLVVWTRWKIWHREAQWEVPYGSVSCRLWARLHGRRSRPRRAMLPSGMQLRLTPCSRKDASSQRRGTTGQRVPSFRRATASILRRGRC